MSYFPEIGQNIAFMPSSVGSPSTGEEEAYVLDVPFAGTVVKSYGSGAMCLVSAPSGYVATWSFGDAFDVLVG